MHNNIRSTAPGARCALNLSITILSEGEDAYVSNIIVTDPDGRWQAEDILGLAWDVLGTAFEDGYLPQPACLPKIHIVCGQHVNASRLLASLKTKFPTDWRSRLECSSSDVAQLSALFTSGLVTFLSPSHYPTIVPWLIDLGMFLRLSLLSNLADVLFIPITAFSDVSPSLATLAYTQLVRLAPRVGSRRSGFSLSSVLRIFLRLGASAAVLEKYGWAALSEGTLNASCDVEKRWEMVHRLAVLVGIFAL